MEVRLPSYGMVRRATIRIFTDRNFRQPISVGKWSTSGWIANGADCPVVCSRVGHKSQTFFACSKCRTVNQFSGARIASRILARWKSDCLRMEWSAGRQSGYLQIGTFANQLAWASGLLAVGLLTGLIVRWFVVGSATKAKPSLPALNAVPLTSFQGRESQAAFSPDGSQIAFVWNGPQGDNQDIYRSELSPTN